MKQQVVRFCDGCGHVFDDSQPESGRVLACAQRDGGRIGGGTTLMSRTQSASAGAPGERTCPRCNGLLVPGGTDVLLPEVHEEHRVLSWRCVNCGEWIDPTVMANRRA
jgi:rubredoxin